MTTYYAVCDANGPISVRLDSDDEEGAIIEFEIATMRLWIDNARTDAEDDYEIVDASTMSEGAFADALESHGLAPVRDLDPIHNAHAGTTAHLAGGWYLWADHGAARAKARKLARKLARQLHRDDTSRADEVPVQRDGRKAYDGWLQSARDASDTDTRDALLAVDRDDFAAAWDQLAGPTEPTCTVEFDSDGEE